MIGIGHALGILALAIAMVLGYLLRWASEPRPRSALPPATAREMRRARKANRIELRDDEAIR